MPDPAWQPAPRGRAHTLNLPASATGPLRGPMGMMNNARGPMPRAWQQPVNRAARPVVAECTDGSCALDLAPAGHAAPPAPVAPAGAAPTYVFTLDPLTWLQNTPAQRVSYFLKMNPQYVGSPHLDARLDQITAWAMKHKPNVRPAGNVQPKGYMRQPGGTAGPIAKILDDALKAGAGVAPAGTADMTFTTDEGLTDPPSGLPADTSVPGDESDAVRLQRLRNEQAEATAAINALVAITNNTVNTVNATDRQRIITDGQTAVTNITHQLTNEASTLTADQVAALTAERDRARDALATAQQQYPAPTQAPASHMSTGAKVGLGAALAAAVAAVAVAATRGKKGKKD